MLRISSSIRKIRFPFGNSQLPNIFKGGDFVIPRPILVLIGYCGERSEKEGAEQIAQFVEAEG